MVRAIYYSINNTDKKIDDYWRDWIDYYRRNYKSLYLKSAYWWKLNNQLIKSNPDASCFICKKKSTLLLHHVRYENLFFEILFRDVYILCFSCHERVHFQLHNNKKVTITYWSMVRRIYFLKYTYRIRTMRPSELLQSK